MAVPSPIDVAFCFARGGDQALVHDRDAHLAPVAQAASDVKAPVEQLTGLGELSSEEVEVGQVAQRKLL